MKLLDLIWLIVNALAKYAKTLEQRKRQKERDDLERNPSSWFARHFRMQNKPGKADNSGNPNG